MRFNFMRIVDQYVGTLLCRISAFFLSVFGKAIPRRDHPAPPEPNTVRKILVMKFLGMGSILQMTSLLHSLRLRYPNAHITLLTFHTNRALGDFDLGVDAVLTVDTSTPWKYVMSNVRVLRQLRRTRFDLVLNLEFFATYATLMTMMVRKRFAMAFAGLARYRTRFFNDFVSYDSAQHVREKFHTFARRLGYDGPMPPLARLHVDQAVSVVAETERRLGFVLEANDYCILININAGEMAPLRRWPEEHFRTVVEDLLKRPAIRCVLLGGPEDRTRVDSFHKSLSQAQRVINLAGRISIWEMVALMEVSHLYLGNDSGPMHFAASVGLPVLALFGPESPRVYGPLANSRNTILYRAEPCSPCLNIYTSKDSRCRDNICLKRIEPQEVLDLLHMRYLNKISSPCAHDLMQPPIP